MIQLKKCLVQFFFKTKAGTLGWGLFSFFAKVLQIEVHCQDQDISGVLCDILLSCLLSWKLILFADHKGTTNFQI